MVLAGRATRCGEAPVKVQRTSVGLDVHARSVVACGLDGDTGEVFQRRLCPDHQEVLEWIKGLPAPVAVTYEAGPTGFGLARFLLAAGIMCLVAAPSKLQRPAGDRVKTDLLRIWPGCCTWVRSWRSRCPAWPRKRPGIWCGPVRTVAVT